MKYLARISVSVAVIVILSVLMIASIPQARSQFVLASWSYPDQYGQGIETFDVFENSTGSWQNVGGPTDWDESGIFEWYGYWGSIKLACWTWFNSSLMDASTTNEGKLYQRHNVTVFNSTQHIVFSQQNFTYNYADPIDPPLWIYRYDVVLDFVIETNEYYTVIVNYEVFW